jgi:hypothetical protein
MPLGVATSTAVLVGWVTALALLALTTAARGYVVRPSPP